MATSKRFDALAVLGSLVLFTACSGINGNGNGNSGVTNEATVANDSIGEQGGTVTLAGQASVFIPPNSLKASLTIQLAESAVPREIVDELRERAAKAAADLEELIAAVEREVD